MKTFETEKHNIPEGATHTCDGVFVKMNDESKDSGWCKVWFEGKWHRNGYLSNCVKIEDQTNIEAPEEKEVEWKSGDKCIYMSDEFLFVGMIPTLDDFSCVIFSDTHGAIRATTADISKPKTKQQREERERLESAYDLYLTGCHAVDHSIVYEFHEFKSAPEAANGWLAIVDKTNYRKESE